MRALVLSGGGANGAYQAGALQHIMCDLECKYDLLVGALNSAYLVQFPVGLLWKNSVYETSPLRKIVEREVDPEKSRTSGKELRVVGVSWDDREKGLWSQDASDIIDGVMASSAFPMFFEDIWARSQWWAFRCLDLPKIWEIAWISATTRTNASKLGATQTHKLSIGHGVHRMRSEERSRFLLWSADRQGLNSAPRYRRTTEILGCYD